MATSSELSEYVQINKSYLESLHGFFDQVVNKEKPSVSGLTAIKKLAKGAAGITKPSAISRISDEISTFINEMLAANNYETFEGNYLGRKNNYLLDKRLTGSINAIINNIYSAMSMILASVYSDDNVSKKKYLDEIVNYIDSLKNINSYKEALKTKCGTFKSKTLITFDPNYEFKKVFSDSSDIKIGKYLDGTIDKNIINTFVNDYAVKKTLAMTVSDTTKDDDTVVEITINISGSDKKFRNMFASGENSDCGIHSILTAFSEIFRKLSNQDEKNTFATFFRKTVGYLASVKQYSEREKKKKNTLYYKKELLERKYRFFTRSIYLDVHDLADITNFFKVNYLQHEKKEPGENFITNINTIESKEYILISNLSGNHFTPIKNKTDNNYIFDESIKDALLEKFKLKGGGEIPTVGGSRKIRKTRSFRKATRKTRKHRKH